MEHIKQEVSIAMVFMEVHHREGICIMDILMGRSVKDNTLNLKT